MRNNDSLTEGRLMMLTRALVSVTTRANLEVKRTVDLVLLCAVDARKVLRAAPGPASSPASIAATSPAIAASTAITTSTASFTSTVHHFYDTHKQR
jgi:hypothetical protein